MKILYLHQYFNTPAMSGGTRSYEMARRLVRAGHEIHIISSYRDNDHADENSWWTEMVDGIHIHWLTVPYSNRLSYGKRIKAFVRFALAAARRACQVGGDIVFATSTPLTIALPGVYASKRLRIPMVFEVRDLWPELPVAVGALKNPLLIALAKWLERFAYRHSAHVVALSPGMADGVAATGYPVEKITVISNAADLELFQQGEDTGCSFYIEYPELSAGPLVIYAGTLGVINGVGYFVDVAKAMLSIDPAVRFLIIGNGKEVASIREKALGRGVLENNLWMISPIAKKDMPALLSRVTVATSLFIDLPEMWNNSANKFFDALAAGRPLMINYQGWQARLLEETGAGIVVPPASPQKAAEMLYGFINDKERIEFAKSAARHLAETCFNRDVLAARLLSLLEKTAFQAMDREK